MITVLLVDDHINLRKSLRYMLESSEDIQVIATASNGVEAVTEARKHCPDVTIMDISMPIMDGIEATRQIHQHCRLTRVVMLSILDNPEYVQRALEVGAVGFVLKDAIARDLLAAIRALSMGKAYFSQQVAEIAARYLNRKSGDSRVS